MSFINVLHIVVIWGMLLVQTSYQALQRLEAREVTVVPVESYVSQRMLIAAHSSMPSI
jgi:hypothetical protein